MRRTLIVGTICALLGAAGVGFAQTETWTNFVLTAPTGGPTVSDVLACIEGSPGKTYNCSVSSIWSVLRSIANIWSGPQEYNPNSFSLNGSTSGATVVNATAVASGTLTLPAATDTLVGRATTDTLTDKTLTSPVLGGTVTGTYALGGTPTISSPVINTPTLNGSGGQLTLPAGPDTLVGRATTDTLTNKTISGSSNTLTNIPGGNLTANSVANSALAQMAANTIKGNNTGLAANAADLTVAQVTAMFTHMTSQVFTSGSGTYTTPANVRTLLVLMTGGGGGGGGNGTSGGGGNGSTGGTTSFGTSLLTANGGGGGQANGNSGAGAGTATGGILNIVGASGGGNGQTANLPGGAGGSAFFGGGAPGGNPGSVGNSAPTNSGGGGGGAGGSSTNGIIAAGGGQAGGFLIGLINNPSATYSYVVGGGGSPGTAGTSGFAGGTGGSGVIIVLELYV